MCKLVGLVIVVSVLFILVCNMVEGMGKDVGLVGDIVVKIVKDVK